LETVHKKYGFPNQMCLSFTSFGVLIRLTNRKVFGLLTAVCISLPFPQSAHFEDTGSG